MLSEIEARIIEDIEIEIKTLNAIIDHKKRTVLRIKQYRQEKPSTEQEQVKKSGRY